MTVGIGPYVTGRYSTSARDRPRNILPASSVVARETNSEMDMKRQKIPRPKRKQWIKEMRIGTKSTQYRRLEMKHKSWMHDLLMKVTMHQSSINVRSISISIIVAANVNGKKRETIMEWVIGSSRKYFQNRSW